MHRPSDITNSAQVRPRMNFALGWVGKLVVLREILLLQGKWLIWQGQVQLTDDVSSRGHCGFRDVGQHAHPAA